MKALRLRHGEAKVVRMTVGTERIYPGEGARGISLKPFKFEVESLTVTPGEGCMKLEMFAKVTDTGSGKTIVVATTEVLSLTTPLVQAVEYVLKRAMTHEIYECLMVDGKHMVQPHPEEEFPVPGKLAVL